MLTNRVLSSKTRNTPIQGCKTGNSGIAAIYVDEMACIRNGAPDIL